MISESFVCVFILGLIAFVLVVTWRSLPLVPICYKQVLTKSFVLPPFHFKHQ